MKRAPTTCQVHCRRRIFTPALQGGLLSPHFFKSEQSLREAQELPEAPQLGRAGTDLTPKHAWLQSPGHSYLTARRRLILNRKLFDKKKDSKMHCVSCSNTKKAKLILKQLLKERVYSWASIRKALKQLKKWLLLIFRFSILKESSSIVLSSSSLIIQTVLFLRLKKISQIKICGVLYYSILARWGNRQ